MGADLAIVCEAWDQGWQPHELDRLEGGPTSGYFQRLQLWDPPEHLQEVPVYGQCGRDSVLFAQLAIRPEPSVPMVNVLRELPTDTSTSTLELVELLGQDYGAAVCWSLADLQGYLRQTAQHPALADVQPHTRESLPVLAQAMSALPFKPRRVRAITWCY